MKRVVPLQGGRRIASGEPCFVIAEAGVNHNGEYDLARRMVDVAADAGADAVKFQTFRAERLVTRGASKAAYQLKRTDSAESQFEMLRKLELRAEDFRRLADHCAARGILFLSTPFDEESADLLETLGIALLKVASGELTNLPFLAHLAGKGIPLILSTGMATLGDVETAIQAIDAAGTPPFALMHCVSCYPAEARQVNLRAMDVLALAFGVPVGFSDHTLGIEVALAAVARGACVVEKHFTLDHSLPGPDHMASLDPGELAALVQGIRTVESALGDGRKVPTAGEANVAASARRSLVAARDLPAGTVLKEEHVAALRPGTGLPPALRSFVVGRTLRAPVTPGTILTLDLLA